MNHYEAAELKAILNQGIKAQLLRGDRDHHQCWLIAIRGINKLNDKIDQMEGSEHEICTSV